MTLAVYPREVYTHARDKQTSVQVLETHEPTDSCLVKNLRSGYEHWVPVPHILAFYVLEGELVD